MVRQSSGGEIGVDVGTADINADAHAVMDRVAAAVRIRACRHRSVPLFRDHRRRQHLHPGRTDDNRGAAGARHRRRGGMLQALSWNGGITVRT